jgi:hypothetical protein
MDKKPRTVELWLRNWYDRRLGSIFTGHQDNNNAGKLTLEQKAEIQQALQSPPSDLGLPEEFWDVPQLKEYVTAQFGVVYECDQSYHFLLRFTNCRSFIRFAGFDLAAHQAPSCSLRVSWMSAQHKYFSMFILENDANCMSFLCHDHSISAACDQRGLELAQQMRFLIPNKKRPKLSTFFSVIKSWCP